jgi:hypothetical protein
MESGVEDGVREAENIRFQLRRSGQDTASDWFESAIVMRRGRTDAGVTGRG